MNADRLKFAGAEESAPSDRFERFEAWLREQGASFPALELREYDAEVRGVHAVRELAADEVVVRIPLRCLITVEMGKATAIGQKVIAADLQLDAPKHVYLMLFLLTDRRDPASRFQPYYDILPPSLGNVPIFWSEAELAWLEGSYLLQQIADRRAAIAADYAAICEVAPELAELASADEFAWARMAVCSRNFGMLVGSTRTAAMVPYADMLNHLRPRETKWTFDNESDDFTITTVGPIAAGQQVYDSYGKKCNHRFLLNYGFAVENNVEDDGSCPNSVSLRFALFDDDAVLDEKRELWTRQHSAGGERRLRVPVGDGKPFREAMSLLRVIVADADDWRRVKGANAHSFRPAAYRTAKDVSHMLSEDNERRALRELRDVAARMEAAYPTSLAADRATLAGGGLEPFSNRRHALIQVLGEKEVLAHLQTLAARALEFLDLGADDRAARLPDIEAGAAAGDRFQAHVAAYLARLAGWSVKQAARHTCRACGTNEDAGSPPLLRCGRCRAAWYCGRDCQQTDWPRHRLDCVPVAEQG